MQEMPAIASSSYASTPLNVNQLLAGGQAGIGNGGGLNVANVASINQFQQMMNQGQQAQPPPAKEKKVMATTTRLVQVFVADPDENVALGKRLLYSGDQKLTDLTDQELFFEIDIKTILDAHNSDRVKMINKAFKERTEFLEPARIRDLKMTVVTIAQF